MLLVVSEPALSQLQLEQNGDVNDGMDNREARSSPSTTEKYTMSGRNEAENACVF